MFFAGRRAAFVRLILDGTVADVRLDRKATAISLLVVLGVRMVRRYCSRRGVSSTI
jgi:hypothetical protein